MHGNFFPYLGMALIAVFSHMAKREPESLTP